MRKRGTIFGICCKRSKTKAANRWRFAVSCVATDFRCQSKFCKPTACFPICREGCVRRHFRRVTTDGVCKAWLYPHCENFGGMTIGKSPECDGEPCLNQFKQVSCCNGPQRFVTWVLIQEWKNFASFSIFAFPTETFRE